MTDILRDPIWQFIGALLALIAIGVSVYIFFLQRTKKSLSYQIMSETELLTVNEEIKGKIQILYEGIPVQKVHLLVLKILNDGNIPVTPDDFKETLSFFFGKKAQILSAEVTETSPKTLKPVLNIIDKNKIVLEPTLINGQDSITTKLLLAQYRGKVTPNARIVGVREVRELKDRTKLMLGLTPILANVLLVGVSSILRGELSGDFTIALAATMLSSFATIYSVVRDERKKAIKAEQADKDE
jgi:hypothetical protein